MTKQPIYIGFLTLFFSSFLHASGVLPDTSVVMINEEVGGGSINVKNTEDTPVLLYSKINNLPDDPEPMVVVTQPVARLEPGQTQRVRFILNSAQKLDREHIKRVSFEGIPASKEPDNDLSLVIRQDLPMLIVPKNQKANSHPANDLLWVMKNDKITVTNSGLQVVRLQPQIVLMPGKIPVALGKSYILPGETLTVHCAGHPRQQNMVMITPVSRYGKVNGTHLLALKH